MSDIQPYQIVTIIVFIAILLAAQIIIKRLIGRGKVTPLQSVMKITETLSLSPKERLYLLNIRGQDFLLCASKAGSSNIVQINSLAEESLDA